MLSDGHMQCIQSRETGLIQRKLFLLWADLDSGKRSVDKVLRACSRIYTSAWGSGHYLYFAGNMTDRVAWCSITVQCLLHCIICSSYNYIRCYLQITTVQLFVWQLNYFNCKMNWELTVSCIINDRVACCTIRLYRALYNLITLQVHYTLFATNFWSAYRLNVKSAGLVS